MVQIFFFDIDGTLVDHDSAEKIGISFIYDKYKSIFNNLNEDKFYRLWIETSQKYMNEYLEGNISFKEQRIKRLQNIFLHFNKKITQNEAFKIFLEYLNKYERSWKCFEDVVPCLNNLKKYQLGIISNGDKEQQIKKLKRANILHYFKYLIISSDVGHSKPESEIFISACEKVNLSPDQVVYIGDNLDIDIKSANKIGIHAILIDRTDKYDDIKIDKINTLEQLKMG